MKEIGFSHANSADDQKFGFRFQHSVVGGSERRPRFETDVSILFPISLISDEILMFHYFSS